ncbi:TerB family tellurite resistance protein [Kiloniella laminariae]|uniref:TerB family tellurite resistance protein n=1 Tax=Kiloniella laminariae TaxID=454162 RepID=A0ABT4LKI0_9PROT|nr:TerB family tellurite resistance protein [Kiloniella laminariae]MCZ4281460.1 TerB family tellurite resistance protein [Kiloniella laminariae]
MLNRIKELFTGASEAAGKNVGRTGDVKVAAAALMVEAARMDEDFGEDERKKIFQLLEMHFGLSREESEDLLNLAEEKAGESSQLFGFTRLLKESYSLEERIGVMEMLWEVAYADGELHHFEASLMRRIAGLLYVPDHDNGNARKKALARLGLTG